MLIDPKNKFPEPVPQLPLLLLIELFGFPKIEPKPTYGHDHIKFQ
jgi:hypothetical protein